MPEQKQMKQPATANEQNTLLPFSTEELNNLMQYLVDTNKGVQLFIQINEKINSVKKPD